MNTLSQKTLADGIGVSQGCVSLLEVSALAKMRFLIEWYDANGWPRLDDEEQRKRAEIALNAALDRTFLEAA